MPLLSANPPGLRFRQEELMADAAIFIGWGNPVRGREAKSLQVFGESMAFWGQLKKAGAIDDVQAFLLEPHGGDLAGFVVLSGDRAKLAEVHGSEDFQRLTAQAGLIVENLGVDAPVPDLVIYLQASVDAIMSRLARRNSRYDRYVDRNYVEKLTDAYARFFHAYVEGPLLIVNASEIDPVNNDADYEQLFQQIERTTGGRHFFNPVAAVMA